MTKRLRSALTTVLATGLALLLAAPARAINSRAGTSGAAFLTLGAGARAGAMAEAYSALADDVYSLYYNPAGLTALVNPQLAAAHSEHFQDISYEFAGFAYPLARSAESSRHVLGAAIYNLSVPDIERRTTDTPTPSGTFDAGDYSYALTYARRIDERLSAGVTGKYVHSTIDRFKSDAFAVDAGVQYRPYPKARRPMTFAAVIKNVGSKQNFAGVTDPLPMGVVLGFGYRPTPRLAFDVDLTKYNDTDVFGAAGAEYMHPFTKDVAGALRGGFSTHRRENQGFNEITLGAGIGFHRVGFDLAWVPFGTLGNTFRFSMRLNFGGWYQRPKAESAPAAPEPQPQP